MKKNTWVYIGFEHWALKAPNGELLASVYGSVGNTYRYLTKTYIDSKTARQAAEMDFLKKEVNPMKTTDAMMQHLSCGERAVSAVETELLHLIVEGGTDKEVLVGMLLGAYATVTGLALGVLGRESVSVILDYVKESAMRVAEVHQEVAEVPH